MPIVADTAEAATVLLRDYAVDVAVVPVGGGSRNWEALPTLYQAAPQGARMIVLCQSVRKRERQWADEHGVTALTYRLGQEEHVVATVTASGPAPIAEISR